jgi:hypothetical protein
MDLQELIQYQLKDKPKTWKLPQSVIAIDPGMTTGYCRFEHYPFQGYILEDNGVIKVNKQTGWDPIIDLIQSFYRNTPNSVVVCEDYRIYPSKDKVHVLSSVDTVRIIGAIEFMCHHDHVPLVKQMASVHKGFVTDTKLKEWGLYKDINKHARDAVKAAIYFILFNKEY